MDNFYRQIEIIIPVYNCKAFLRESVQSVLGQCYQQLEIILVDDGSTDGSSELCDKLADNNSKVHVIHQKNCGVASARNVGIEYVLSLYKGKEETTYISFLDADDAWVPGFFNAKIIEIIMKEYDLIGFQSCLCNCDLTRRNETISLKAGEYRGGNSSLWIHGTQHFGAMFYRCSLLKIYKIRFKLLKYSEDKIFSMSCLYLADKICLVNSLLYLYRQNMVSILHNRMYGISYFEPIIGAYLNWNKDMMIWKNTTRGEPGEGTILAQIYLMDMIEEHLQMGGNKNQLENFFIEHPIYQYTLESATSKNIIKKRNCFLRYPFFYVLGNKIKGFLRRFARKCFHISIIQNHIENLRYPIEL